MRPTVQVGNDVVALSGPGVGQKHLDQRFMARVFSPSERNLILSASGHESQVLWALWAAKESSFKVVRKRDPDAVFAHALFIVEGDDLFTSGWVTYGHLKIALRWEFHPSYIHCLATSASDFTGIKHVVSRMESSIISNLDAEEKASVHSPASLQVRMMTKKWIGGRVRIVRRPLGEGLFGPPLLFVEGREFDLSLSHDGEWLAAAFVRHES